MFVKRPVFITLLSLIATVDLLGPPSAAAQVPTPPLPANPQAPTLTPIIPLGMQRGTKLEKIAFARCNQYTIQGDCFSESILNGTDVPFPIADAVGNMQAIDAVRESAEPDFVGRVFGLRGRRRKPVGGAGRGGQQAQAQKGRRKPCAGRPPIHVASPLRPAGD